MQFVDAACGQIAHQRSQIRLVGRALAGARLGLIAGGYRGQHRHLHARQPLQGLARRMRRVLYGGVHQGPTRRLKDARVGADGQA